MSHWMWLLFPAVALIWGVYWLVVTLLLGGWPTRGQYGDMFGAVNALFSGFAFAGIIIAIFLQRRELMLQREELSRSVKAQEQQVKAQEQAALMNARAMLMNYFSRGLVGTYSPTELDHHRDALIKSVADLERRAAE